MTKVKQLMEGDSAPEIQLETDTGSAFKLSSLKGKTVVLYFYPRADTPGCTKEACDFRDNLGRIFQEECGCAGNLAR